MTTPELLKTFGCQCEARDTAVINHADECPVAIAYDLAVEIRKQDSKHGSYLIQDGTPLGISRLALASLEDETAAALASWRDERGDITWARTRAEVLQVAAVAFRTLRDALPSPRP